MTDEDAELLQNKMRLARREAERFSALASAWRAEWVSAFKLLYPDPPPVGGDSQ